MTKRKMIPAVGYARRSTDLQERSIPDQQAYVTKWAADNGYKINRWYIDDALSGTSTRGRDAFTEMIEAAEKAGDFETIICYDIARFSRGGTNETGYYIHRLKLADVNVLFPSDSIPEGDEGELIQGVKSWQARQYSVKLARDSIRGQVSNIRERKSAPGGPPCYGYDKQHQTHDGKVLRTLRWMPDGSKQEFGPDGKLLRTIEAGANIKKAKSDIIRLVPSAKDRVDTIKRMYRMCLDGYGFHSIADALNRDSIPSPTGQSWSTSRVAKLMKNPTYKGAICWNKHSMGSLFGLDGAGGLRPRQKRGWKKNVEADWIISEGVHEPLVSVETWNAAQEAARKRATLGGKARPTNRSLLSSLMVCKRCGCSFTIARDRRHPGPEGEGYRSYRCCGYHRYGKSTCGFYDISAPKLEAFVVDAIKQTIVGKHKDVRSAIEAFIPSIRKPTQAAKPTKDVANEVALLNRKIKATIGMLSDPTFDGLDELKTTLADLKAKRDALESQASAVAKKAIAIPSADELRRWAIERFGRIDEFVCKPNPTLQDRQLVEAFVDRIEIEPDTKQATVYLFADLESAYKNGFTRDPRGDFMGAHEWAFYGWKEGAGHKYYGPKNATDLWQVKKINPQSMSHLTQKPAELAVRAMQYSSVQGENVLDLFGGSGSTMIGAEQCGRNSFLMELDTLYCDVIADRFQRFTGIPAVMERTGESPLPMQPREQNMR